MELTETQERLIISELYSVDVDEAFNDSIDETYSSVDICGIEFEPSRILKECDEIAYNCYMCDWLDAEEFVEVNDSYYNKDEVEELLEDA